MTAASRPTRAGKRALSAVAATAMALPLSFGMMGSAFATGQYPGNQTDVAPTPTSTDTACPPSQVSNPGYTDVSSSSEFWSTQIYCISKYSWAKGTGDGTTYSPTREVTRAEMAAFVGRLAKGAGLTWNTAAYGFTDISSQPQEFQDAINALANAGVISGKSSTIFAPNDHVTRAQMAKFIANTLVKTGVTTANAAGGKDYFADDDGIPGGLEAYINDLAADKIVQGIDNSNYAPNRYVRRNQMAGFIARTTEAEVEAGKIANAYPAANTTVTPATQTAQTGGNATLTVKGANVTNISVAGACVNSSPATKSNTPASADTVETISVTVPISATATAGDCALTTTVTYSNGNTQTFTNTVTVSTTNQTYTVTPNTQATNTVSSGTSNTGSRSYQATGLDSAKTYSIQLFPAEAVKTSGGQVTFTQNSGIGNNTGTSIETVNGTIVAAAGSGAEKGEVDSISPVNGTITFAIDSTVSDQVIPVVYSDDNSTTTLNFTTAPTTTAPQAPTNAFGIGGEKDWTPAEATAFSNPAGKVITVDTANNSFTLDTNADGTPDVTVKYASGDTFTYTSGAFNQTISMSQFAAWLSGQTSTVTGDSVTVTGYNPGASQIDLTNDVPAAPTGVTATYNSTNKNVVVSFTPPTNPDVANYYLNRAPVSSSGTVGTYTQVATGSAATLKAAGYKFTDAPAAAGTYSYVVLADNAHGDKSPKSNASQATVPAAAIPPATPYSLATSVTNGSNAGNNGNALDTNDSFSVELRERPGHPGQPHHADAGGR